MPHASHRKQLHQCEHVQEEQDTQCICIHSIAELRCPLNGPQHRGAKMSSKWYAAYEKLLMNTTVQQNAIIDHV